MDRVQARGRVGFKIKLSEGLGMLTIVPFLLHLLCSTADIRYPSVPPSQGHRGEWEQTGMEHGAPQKITHSTVSPRMESGAVWLLQSQTGYSRAHQMLPTQQPLPRLTLALTPRHHGPPDSPRSKVNTAATHQTRFKSPVSMLNGKSS